MISHEKLRKYFHTTKLKDIDALRHKILQICKLQYLIRFEPAKMMSLL